jgi:transposase InsO family protein
MSQSTSPSRNRVYGTALVCRTWKVSRATVYRHGTAACADPDVARPSLRRGPVGACADQDLLVHIKAEIEASPFQGEGYRKIWARLRYKGVRTAARRVRRVMKENGLLAPHRPRVRPEHLHEGTIVTERVDEVWGTDMTQTVTTDQGRAYVFIAVDHCSGQLIGTHASHQATRWEALEPIRQGVARHFGGLAQDRALGLKLRHDHGSNYMSDDFQQEIKFFGIASSPAYVRQPEGNGVAERTIRMLKEQLLWVRLFATVEELRLGLATFATQYNDAWLRQRHGHKTPNQIRAEQRGLAADVATGLKMAA